MLTCAIPTRCHRYESDEAEIVGIGNAPQHLADDFALKRQRCGTSNNTTSAESDASVDHGYRSGRSNQGHGQVRSQDNDDNRSVGCPQTASEVLAVASESWEALFHQHGVNFFLAGHYHEYESLWPSYNGIPTQKNFTDPQATVHITAGNGGAPGSVTHSLPLPRWCFVLFLLGSGWGLLLLLGGGG